MLEWLMCLNTLFLLKERFHICFNVSFTSHILTCTIRFIYETVFKPIIIKQNSYKYEQSHLDADTSNLYALCFVVQIFIDSGVLLT